MDWRCFGPRQISVLWTARDSLGISFKQEQGCETSKTMDKGRGHNIWSKRYPNAWLTWAVFLTCSARKITQDCSVVKTDSSEHKRAIKFFGAWGVHSFYTCFGTAYSVWHAPYCFQSTGHLPSLPIWKKKCHKEQKTNIKKSNKMKLPHSGDCLIPCLFQTVTEKQTSSAHWWSMPFQKHSWVALCREN